MACKRPQIIKNKFISTLIGTIGIFLGIGFALPVSNFSVYITSYIHYKHEFVTMYYGMFLNLIFTTAMTGATSFGGILENIIGFYLTTLLGLIILIIGNIFFIFQRNIWVCYILTLIMGLGTGISTSLLGKNLTLYYPEKKGIISGIIGLVTILFAAIFAVTGEKIIAFNGYTLGEEEEFYPEYIANRTYIYYLLGLITIPIGGLLALLFLHEYNPEEFQINNNNENSPDNNKENEPETKTNPQNEKLIDDNLNEKEKEKEKEEEKKEEEKKEEEKKEEEKNDDKEIILNKATIKNHIMKVVKTLRFWRLCLISFLINFSLQFMVNTGRTFGAIIGINGQALQFLMVFQVVGLMILGPLLGISVDKQGPLFILKILAIVSIIPGILLTFFMEITFIFILSFLIDILGTIAMMVCFSPLIMEIYGIQESVILMGIINVFSKLSEIITTVIAFIASFIYSKEEIKSPYRILYIISAICCCVCTFLIFLESRNKFEYSTEEENINNIKEDIIPTNEEIQENQTNSIQENLTITEVQEKQNTQESLPIQEEIKNTNES